MTPEQLFMQRSFPLCSSASQDASFLRMQMDPFVRWQAVSVDDCQKLIETINATRFAAERMVYVLDHASASIPELVVVRLSWQVIVSTSNDCAVAILAYQQVCTSYKEADLRQRQRLIEVLHSFLRKVAAAVAHYQSVFDKYRPVVVTEVPEGSSEAEIPQLQEKNEPVASASSSTRTNGELIYVTCPHGEEKALQEELVDRLEARGMLVSVMAYGLTHKAKAGIVCLLCLGKSPEGFIDDVIADASVQDCVSIACHVADTTHGTEGAEDDQQQTEVQQ